MKGSLDGRPGWSLGQVLKHLRAVQRTHPKMRSGSAIDSRLVPLRGPMPAGWKRFWQKMNFVDAIKADRVVRSDAGISFENLLICSLSLLSKRSTRNSLPQSARATKHSAVSCAAMGTFTPRRRTHVPSGFARAMRALHRFRPMIDGLPQGKYLVLAERNTPSGGLAEGIQHLFDSFDRLRKMPIFRGVRGAIVALEITYNREMMEPDFCGERLPWHPHLNIVADAPFIPFEELRDAWILATEGRGRTAFVRSVDRGTANELLKYVTKLLDFIDVPLAVEEFLASTHRRRFIRTYGSMYGLKIEDEPDGCCPDCDSRTLRVVAHTLYPHQIFFDSVGVLRIHGWALPVSPEISALRCSDA